MRVGFSLIVRQNLSTPILIEEYIILKVTTKIKKIQESKQAKNTIYSLKFHT